MTQGLLKRALAVQRTFLFRDMSLENLIPLVGGFEELSYPEESWIFREDTPASRCFIMLHGIVTIYYAEQEHTFDKTFLFGEDTLLTQAMRNYSAQTKETTLLLAIERDTFFHMIEKYPAIGLSLLESYATHLLQPGCIARE